MKKSLINLIKTPLPDRADYARTEWRFWPSEASFVKPDGTIVGKCLRSSFYRWKKAPITNPVNDTVKLLGNIGCFVEYATRKELLTKGIYPAVANEKKKRKFRVNLVDDIILSGEVDIVVGNDIEHCGMEVKSYSNSTSQLLNRPKYPHLLQTFLYAVYFEPKQPFFIIKYIPSMIYKYAISNVYHRIDWIEIDNEVYPVINGGIDKDIRLSSIIRRYKESKYYIKNSILPKREFTKSTKNCKQCAYKKHCWLDKGGETIGNCL